LRSSTCTLRDVQARACPRRTLWQRLLTNLGADAPITHCRWATRRSECFGGLCHEEAAAWRLPTRRATSNVGGAATRQSASVDGCPFAQPGPPVSETGDGFYCRVPRGGCASRRSTTSSLLRRRPLHRAKRQRADGTTARGWIGTTSAIEGSDMCGAAPPGATRCRSGVQEGNPAGRSSRWGARYLK